MYISLMPEFLVIYKHIHVTSWNLLDCCDEVIATKKIVRNASATAVILISFIMRYEQHIFRELSARPIRFLYNTVL